MHDAAVTGVVIGLMALGGFAGLVAGRYIWPSLRGVHTTIRELKAEAALEADEAYVEGWDDALADRLRGDADTTILRLGPPPDLPGPASDMQTSARAGEPNWLTATLEQLSPEHIQDVPGVAPSTAPAVQNHAGDHHQDDDYDRPLPTFLHLGAEYTGDDKWRARMTWRGWDQVARHEAARARLALECGIRFVPMDELEAAA